MAGLGQGIKAELIGKKFNNLLVLKQANPRNAKQSNKIYYTWECLCDCGNKVILTGKQLKRGQVSCGCKKLKGQFRKLKSDEDINIGKTIDQYKGGARKRNLIWNLSFSEAKRLLLSNCYYCNTPPNRKMQAYKKNCASLYVLGIDRKDNSGNYIIDNVVPCCKLCNRTKADLGLEEFMRWIKQLVNFNKTLIEL